MSPGKAFLYLLKRPSKIFVVEPFCGKRQICDFPGNISPGNVAGDLSVNKYEFTEVMVIDKSWTSLGKHEKEFYTGLKKFIDDCKPLVDSAGNIICPCKSCRLVLWVSIKHLSDHISNYGFDPNYKTWIHHGKPNLPLPPPVIDNTRQPQMSDMTACLKELSYIPLNNEQNKPTQRDIGETSNDPTQAKCNVFEELYASANEELYPGCDYVTRLDFMAKFTYFKAKSKLTDSIFNEMLEFFQNVFPTTKGYKLPPSHYAIKKTFKIIELGYESIHACVNNCFLFWGDANKDVYFCPVCNTSRWKDSNTPGKKVPKKVLRYFSIIPRLQRLYNSSHTAKEMTWHATGKCTKPGKMQHLVDGKAWKDFHTKYSDFAVEPRNVRLGLAADGFNPFGNLSQSYSIRLDRNVDCPPPMCQLQVFISLCKSIGLWSVIRIDLQELKKVIWYVLHNSPEIDMYRAKFKIEFPNKDMKEEFPGWFGKQEHGEAFKNDQYILATQVKQCFYLEDMARQPPGWKVVEHVSHKKFLNGCVIVVEDDPDVIHVDNSSDLALSTSLNDLEITALHLDDVSRCSTGVTTTQFDLRPHMESDRWPQIYVGIQQHLKKDLQCYIFILADKYPIFVLLYLRTQKEWVLAKISSAPLLLFDHLEIIGQGTVIPSPSQSTHSADIARLKKREKLLTKQVKMFMRLFRSDDKFSQMLTQLESQPEYGGGSGSGGCEDDEPGDDEDGNEDEEDEEDEDDS
nr:hypothetical protein [Tanacetum cinerariifolium]